MNALLEKNTFKEYHKIKKLNIQGNNSSENFTFQKK